MIRAGVVKAQASRVSATIRGLRDRIAGHLRGVASLDARDDGATSGEVMGHLARKHPNLIASVDGVARAAARAAWDPRRPSLESLTVAATQAVCRELAARLRSGRYVTNTVATIAAKDRAGHGTTPGVDTEQLARALDAPRITVE